MDGLGHCSLYPLASYCKLIVFLLYQQLLRIQLLSFWICSLEVLWASIIAIKSFRKPEALAFNASTLDMAMMAFSSLARYWEVMCIVSPNT